MKSGTQTTSQMLYGLMAVYYALLSMNNGFCRFPQRHNFHFKQVLLRSMQTLLVIGMPKNADGQMDK